MKLALLLGVEKRSGTNYLFDLLGNHDDCDLAAEVGEDFLLAEVGYFRKYLNVLWNFWRKFKPGNLSPETMNQCAERFLKEMLMIQNSSSLDKEGVFLSKTPSNLGIEHLPTLFRETKFLFLMRDGRSVAYSLCESFGVSFLSALSRWQDGARRLLQFMKANATYFERQCLLVRYEDLFTDPQKELYRIFKFLELDEQKYRYEYAESSPVIGSSELRKVSSTIHWHKEDRKPDFNPLERFEKWPRWKQNFSAEVLRKELHEFGYKTEFARGRLSASFLSVCYRVFQFVRWLRIRNLKATIKSTLLR